MNRRVVVSIQLWLVSSIFIGCQKEVNENTDRFSGKEVTDFQMAKELILERKDNYPKVGELAPKFELFDLNSESQKSLGDLHREKPLVLILGSGSCSILCRSDSWINAFQANYGDRFNFSFVYIREAHTLEGYQPRSMTGSISPLVAALDDSARKRAAAEFLKMKELTFPVLVDSVSDDVAIEYSAWPVRLFVIGTDGRVLYSGGQAPWYYHPFEAYQHSPTFDPDLKKLPQSSESLESFLEKGMAR